MYRPSVSQLNATSMDIMNTIRQNASPEYQATIPAIDNYTEIPKVGEVIWGYPAFANQFVSTLVNRIILTLAKSSTFNNPYRELKKGYPQFGATIEESFVEMAKAREFNVEKAPQRELARTLPDVKTAFHSINWRVQYPVTIQYEDLKRAFLSPEGLNDMVNRIVESLNRGNEYDEFLLFKYLMIKGVNREAIKKIQLPGDTPTDAVTTFKSYSNLFRFVKTDFNVAGVHTNTPVEDQYIFLDTGMDASYDVNVLASAFNMDKASFMGHRFLMDDWTTFDNDRFAQIRSACDCIEEVSPSELSAMANIRAILADKEFFQVYDNLTTMTENRVESGLYWNYNLNIWKTIDYSPFSNVVAFSSTAVTPHATFEMAITDKSSSENATILTLVTSDPTIDSARLIQNQDATGKGIAVHPYGVIIYPEGQTTFTPTARIGNTLYTASAALASTSEVGASVTFNKNA